MRIARHNPPAMKINVTPMIDVMMVLIIFYLLVGNLLAQRTGFVDLPPSTVGALAPDLTDSSDPCVITVEADGRTLINGRPIDTARLDAEIGRAVLGVPWVEIRGARAADYAIIRPVIEACREAGVPQVAFVAEQS